jgi:hypothetical protein
MTKHKKLTQKKMKNLQRGVEDLKRRERLKRRMKRQLM